jgi:hypothetical protein
MDTVVVSIIAVVAAFISAVIGALFGSVVGPVINARLERTGSLSIFVRDQRRDAYTKFVVHVEEAQRLVDATASGAAPVSYSLSDVHPLEIARVKIDVFGTHLAKMWAYRCTLSLIALAHVINERPGDLSMLTLPRAKLHEARANLVRVVRYELGVSAHEKNDSVSQLELKQTRAEIQRSSDRVDSDGHHAWLNGPTSDPTAMSVGPEAILVYRRAATAAIGEMPGGREGETEVDPQTPVT